MNSVRDYMGLNFSVARPGLPPEMYPKINQPIVPYLSYTSEMNDKAFVVSKTLQCDRNDYVIKMALSTGDVHALQCLYLKDTMEHPESCTQTGYNPFDIKVDTRRR